MIKIAITLIQIICAAAGAYIGLSLKSSGTSSAPEKTATHDDKKVDKKTNKKKEKKDKKKDKDHKKEKSKKSDGHGGSYGESGDSNYGFMKFSRQFIVPVVSSDKVNSLVVLDINLEVSQAATEKAYSREPKLRDALLSTLLVLSNEGAFGDRLLDQENIDNIRAMLLASAKEILGDEVEQVLILSIARKDF